jgi:hypothetical protein
VPTILPSGDLQSKINRAVRGFLIAQGAATPDNCYAAPSSYDRTLPNTTVETPSDGVYDPRMGPGNLRFDNVAVILRDNAVAQANDPDMNDPRIAANNRMTLTYNALNQTVNNADLGYTAQQITLAGRALAVDPTNGANAQAAQSAADNADLQNFCCLFWWLVRIGEMKTDSKGVFWERELVFGGIFCNASLTP